MSTHSNVYEWSPLDNGPFDSLTIKAAQVVGITPEDLRAGEALSQRAPAALLKAWEAEQLTTYAAYTILRLWESGDLTPQIAQSLGFPDRPSLP